MCGGVLVPLSFHDANKELIRNGVKGLSFIETAAIVGLALMVLGVVAVVTQKSVGRDESFRIYLRGVLQTQWFSTCLLFLMALLPLLSVLASIWQEAAVAALVSTILANCAMIACAFWLMSTGLREDRTKPFAWGVMYFLLWIVLRYVDLFGDFGGMLGASLMFFICGATLLGVALYWRRRKEMRHA